MPDHQWLHYERRKAVWIAAHPAATPEEYEQAAIREFRGDKSDGLDRRIEKQIATSARPAVPPVVDALTGRQEGI